MISTVFIGCGDVSQQNAGFVEKYEKLNPCTVFFDEEQALDFLEKNRSLLLTVIDSYMGKTDVVSFIKKAKSRGSACDYIVFTADNNRERVTELYYSGVFRVVIKPFDYELFCSVVDDYERYLFSGKQYVGEKKRLPISSALDAEVLDLTAKRAYTEKELSQKLEKPVVIIKQSLNRLISNGMVESETKEFGDEAITRYKKVY